MQESQSAKASKDVASPIIEPWRKAEWNCVIQRRKRAYSTDSSVDPNQEPENIAGLALSGGGIRSALFNDGFLQALSHRGLLRYFDFLCSVSGGGYIAGHLVSQSKENSGHCFHDDDKPVDKPRRELGRDPATGKIDRSRLAGIGSYLSRPLEFIPSYLWSLLFSLAFYLGALGVLATLAALFWRSFDNVHFREVYVKVLGLNQFGDELLIAFLPVLLFVFVTVLVEGFLWLVGMAWEKRRSDVKLWQRRFRATMLLSVLFALFASIAIYLGNGKSYVRGGTDIVYLNHYVQYMAIAAGAIQILMFLGRDRLFRSERSEAKGWQRHLQQSITTIVVFFLAFSMVHWMGREDISEYTAHRDPHLVVGDVLNWPQLAMIRQGYETHQGISAIPEKQFPYSVVSDFLNLPMLTMFLRVAEVREFMHPLLKVSNDGFPSYGLKELNRKYENHLEPQEKWRGFLVRSRLNMFGLDEVREEDLSWPPPPSLTQDDPSPEDAASNSQKVWMLPSRIVGAAYAYQICVVEQYPKSLAKDRKDRKGKKDNKGSEGDPAVVDSIANAPLASSSDKNTPSGDPEKTESIASQIRQRVQQNVVRREQREDFLKEFNEQFQSIAFTRFLISRLEFLAEKEKPTGTPTSGSDAFKASGLLAEITRATGRQFSEKHQKEIATTVHSLGLPSFLEDRSVKTANSSTPLDSALHPAMTNRLLLEALYPSTVQRYDIASTLVVPPYDQTTRVRWLISWMIVSLVGLVGGFGPHRVATVYHFYRKQLSRNFLVSCGHPEERSGEKKLSDIKPHLDGLPYPLILAAALEPSLCNGGYRVAARPFVFSPLHCGSFEAGETPIGSQQVSYSRNPSEPSLTFADAITLSGAAVTPLMTQNRWLTVILDFFNTGIGQRVYRNDRTNKGPVTPSRQPLILSGLICLLLIAGSINFLELRWSLLVMVPAFVLFCYCWNSQIGAPGLIRSLVLLKENNHEADFNQNQSFYVADGGYVDYLGVSELLRRRCELIVVSDAGANVGGDSLGTLARMCERAAAEQGVRFLDLDHDAPIDFGRLEIDKTTRLVHQPFICMRVRYPDAERREGLLVYCQMSITDSDPIEIKNIRNLFPSFPDEPTVNQFYNEKQVAAYRSLGYHIGSRFCNELHPWFDGWTSLASESIKKPSSKPPKSNDAAAKETLKVDRFRRELESGLTTVKADWESSAKQPLFDILKNRLLMAYRLACYEEVTYSDEDIFREAVWTSSKTAFPTFNRESSDFQTSKRRKLADWWLERYELNADVRSAYRTAVLQDINSLEISNASFCGALFQVLCKYYRSVTSKPKINRDQLAAHLTCVAVACQEVHRGRPHAALQVGGRAKLIDLCERIAEIISNTAPEQSKEGRTLADLLHDMDTTIAELIEMERSIFQGGEHVATISFAQCMSNLWGMLARQLGPDDGQEHVLEFTTKSSNAFGIDGDLSMFERTSKNRRASVVPIDLMAAEVRRQLDVGMKKIRLTEIRAGLAKSWYLGYFTSKSWDAVRDQLLDPEANSEADRAKQDKETQKKPIAEPEDIQEDE